MGVGIAVFQRLQDIIRQRIAEFEEGTSLGRKLIAVLLPLVLVPMIIMGLAAYLQTRNIVGEQLEDELASRINDKLFDLTDWITVREEQLILDAGENTIRGRVSELLDEMEGDVLFDERQNDLRTLLENKRISMTNILFDDYLVAQTSDGQILAATQRQWEGESIDADMLRDLLLSETFTYAAIDHPLFRISEEENFAILTHAPISASEGGLNEAILIGVSTNYFKTDIVEDIQRKWLAPQDGEAEIVNVYIVAEPNIFLEISPSGMIALQRFNSGHPALSHPTLTKPRTQEYKDIFGESVLGSYAWIPTAGIGLAVELPRRLYLSEINSLAPFSILLILLATLFTVIVVPFASNRLLRPLSKLTEFAQRVARGDWQYRVPVESDDEVGMLSQSLNMMAEELSQSYRSLEDRVSDRTRQLRIASQVARVVISSPSLADLLRRGVELIKSQFGYYHVSIFLIDEEGENAQLAESSGEIGQALKARGHSLKVGGQSIIGWVTANNQPRIAYDVTQDPLHLANELLPETRSEAAVPLQVAGRVLGALDVQSTEAEAFSPQDIEILQTLADQFCAAIQNAKLAITSITAADRARLMSQVTQELSRQMTVEDVMQTTAKSLHRALGHPEIVVRMNTAQSESSLYTEYPTSSDTDLEA
jgi:HAMP domain-containing protein